MNEDLLREKLKEMVIKACDVKNVTVSDINNDEPLINGPGALPLDSLDALEIVSKINEHFGIKVENASTARSIFGSFTALSKFLYKKADPKLTQKFLSTTF
ncbi:MAG: acyl carrier protein [Oligoflexales bacterium]